MTNVFKALRSMERLEEAMAALYGRMVRYFAHDRALEVVFARLQAEEISHRDLVRFAIRMVTRSGEPFEDLDIDTGRIEDVVKRASVLLRDGDAEEAADVMRAAMGIEQSAAECHFHAILGAVHPQMAALVNNLASGDIAHHKMLEAVALPA